MGPSDKNVAKDRRELSEASSLVQGLSFTFYSIKAQTVCILVLCVI